MLGEDQFFSMSANVVSTGPQSTVLKGFLVSERSDGQYIAPLIPQLFYGADGNQLSTWRQNLTATGEQVILSRSGGLPTVPREELWWRKVKPTQTAEEAAAVPTSIVDLFNALPLWQKVLIGLGIVSASLTVGYLVAKK